MKQKKFAIRSVNKVFILGLAVIFILFASISCYSSISFQLRRRMLQLDNVLNQMFEAYYEKVYSLSEVYASVFLQDPDQSAMRAYFTRRGDKTLSAVQFMEMANILSVMVLQDNDIDWVALYNPYAERNYFLSRGSSKLSMLPANFPYMEDAAGKGMKLLGAKSWTDHSGVSRLAYCIKGGSVPAGVEGCIFVGYNMESMKRILKRAEISEDVTYMVLAHDQVVFDSSDTYYGKEYDSGWIAGESMVCRDESGGRWFTGRLKNTGREFTCVYIYPWVKGVLNAMSDAPLLLGLLMAFSGMALALYLISSRRIFHRVTQIGDGLAIIGRNNLNHRLKISAVGDEFDEIARSINSMTAMLQTALDQEYELRLKHMHLQMTQIQARFNPHFLYNTLEMIRGRLFENGDIESADYIEKLARIFRNLTDAKAVVRLQDELSFCSLYVALLQLRASGAVNVSYDVAPELLDCGVIANLIQPAIENYFVHAMVSDEETNELEITCEPHGADNVRIVISDNGHGITEERMADVNRQLASPDMTSASYGLMSSAKRIKLFYGEQYGVHMEKNPDAGVRVVIDIPRMSMKEHEDKLMPTR